MKTPTSTEGQFLSALGTCAALTLSPIFYLAAQFPDGSGPLLKMIAYPAACAVGAALTLSVSPKLLDKIDNGNLGVTAIAVTTAIGGLAGLEVARHILSESAPKEMENASIHYHMDELSQPEILHNLKFS